MAEIKSKRKNIKVKEYYKNNKKRLSSITKKLQRFYKNLLEEEKDAKRIG